MVKCNTKLEDEDIHEAKLVGNMDFHDIGLIVTALFAAIATAISFFLIFKHATHFSKPMQQIHIIRILFMIPIYGVVSFLSYLFYHHSVYYEVLRDCYEAFAIASFFALLCAYVAPDVHSQKDFFRGVTPKNWIWPMNWAQKCTGGMDRGWLRKPASGLTWFNIIWIGVFHYCFIRVCFTIISVIAQANGVYCESSNSPAFASIWAAGFNALAVSVAMYCLIQFYFQMKEDLAEHRPFLKVLSIKLVIFFVFWQGLLISLLASSGPLKPTKTIAYADIQVGIPSMLISIEMTGFAILHIFSFSWKPYVGAPSHGGPLGLYAYVRAFNPWDMFKAVARGFRWLFVGVRHRHHDISYRKTTHELDDTKRHSNDTESGSTTAEQRYANTKYEGVATSSPPRHGRNQQGTNRYDEDSDGLLSHAAPYSSNSYGDNNGGYLSQSVDSNPDNHLGPAYPQAGQDMPYPTQYGGFEAPTVSQSSGGARGSRYYEAAGAGRPRPTPPAKTGSEWEMFGGALKPGQK